jgi:hypothetical protein
MIFDEAFSKEQCDKCTRKFDFVELHKIIVKSNGIKE